MASLTPAPASTNPPSQLTGDTGRGRSTVVPERSPQQCSSPAETAAQGPGCVETVTPSTTMQVESQDATQPHAEPRKTQQPDGKSQGSELVLPLGEDARPDSSASDTSSGSYAVDMVTEPTEVIVEGKNVRKVSIKFAPQPPNVEGQSGVVGPVPARRRSIKSHYRRQAPAGRSIEQLPLSQEETSAPDPSCTPCPPQTNIATPGCQSSLGASSFVFGDAHSGGAIYSSNSYSNTAQVGRSFRARQDILGGLEALERTRDELTEINGRLNSEVQRLNSLNSDLENRIEGILQREQQAEDELDELKIKLDASEKENMRLGEQALNQWQVRVRVEELAVVEKAQNQNKVAEIQTQLSLREKELADARKSITELNRRLETAEAPYKEMQLEFMTRLERIKEDLNTLTKERDQLKTENSKLFSDLQNLQMIMSDQQKKIEGEHKRFLSLKKSYNELDTEKNLLKASLRGRRNSLGNSSNNSGQSGGEAHVEMLHLIDLPTRSLPSPRTGTSCLQLPPAATGRKRGKTATGVPHRQHQALDTKQGLSSTLPPVKKELRK